MGGKQKQHFEVLIGCLVLLLFVFVGSVFSNAIGQKNTESAAETESLYDANDRVIVLNVTNFKANIYNSKRTWLVKFYNSWCGFCRRFAPIWKALANNVQGWEDIVAIAAIDCANDVNTQLCREYEIMRYPTLKFYHIDLKPDNLGLEIQKDKDETLIMQALIDQLEKEEQEQRAVLSWPNIALYRANDVETLWQGVPDNIQYQFLIFEKPKSYLGAEVILDLHKLDNIRVRRVSSENQLLCVTNKVTTFPSIIVTDKDHSKTFIKVNTITREGIREIIIEFLKSKGISVDIEENEIEIIKQDVSHNVEITYEDKLYQLDLETALRYSLRNEVSLKKYISGDQIKALKDYLKVLASYFSIHLPKTKTFLQVLVEVMESRYNMTGKEFRGHFDIKEKGLAPVFSGPKVYIGCKGSQPTLRGYTCGLWTLFHTLTVSEAEDFSNGLIDNDHPTVLSAMHGYIKHFFGCADCADHFQEMAQKRKLFEVLRGDDSILWLWKAHNEVNERLSGDETDDPEHKKIQYPAAENCPKCRLSDGKWDEKEVLKYLKKKYNKSYIDLQGISEELLKHERDISAASSGVSTHKIGWDFTIFDISICVVLYVTSAAILTLVCIKFAYKRTYRKKISFQNLFSTA